MANISQNVNIEMLEKLPDGTYKRKYPKTTKEQVGLGNVDNVKQATKVEFDDHLEDEMAHGIGNKNTLLTTNKSTLVGAMNELFTNVSNGKQLVGGAITDVDDSVVIPADPTFQQLADAVGQISTGKKWATGTVSFKRTMHVSGLDFAPSVVVATGTASTTDTFAIGGRVGTKLLGVYYHNSEGFSTPTLGENNFSITLTQNINERTGNWIAYE